MTETNSTSGPTFVYVACAAYAPDTIKVGIATSLKSRLSVLGTSVDEPLVMWCVRRFPTRAEAVMTERNVHAAIADYRAKGEWFDIDAMPAALRIIGPVEWYPIKSEATHVRWLQEVANTFLGSGIVDAGSTLALLMLSQATAKRRGGVSRAWLTAASGLNARTVDRFCKKMLDKDLIEEVGALGGRPTYAFRFEVGIPQRMLAA